MNLIDKGNEILHKVIDDKKENEKVVLQKTKEDLLQLKEDVSYATTVLEELKKTGWVDQQKFQTLDAKLRDNNHKQEAINEIAGIVEEIYNKYDTLQDGEKNKIKAMTEALKNSQNSLSNLKNELLQKPNINYETIENELVNDATAKLDEHRYTKWLKEPYKKHIHEKVEEMKNGKKDEEKGARKKFVSSIENWFFGLIGTMFIGKELLDGIKEKLEKYGKGAIDKARNVKDNVQSAFNSALDKGKDTKDAVTDPEKLKEQENKAKRYIKTVVKKNFHKDLTDAQIEGVAKRMNLKERMKDGTSEWNSIIQGNEGNYLDATVQTVAIPFVLFGELVTALDAEGIINIQEAAFTVTGNVVEYGLRGFKLFGVGLAAVCGKIDLKELNGHIAHLYEKSPFAAKQLLFALVYRSMDGPLIKMVMNTTEFLAKTVSWTILESGSDVKFMKDALHDMHRGNMNTAITQMKETQALIEQYGVQDPWLQKVVRATEETVQQYEKFNAIVVKTRELSGGPGLVAALKTEFAADQDIMRMLNGYREADNRKEFLSWLGGEREGSTKRLSQTFKDSGSKWGVGLKNWGAKTFIGDSSVRHVIMDFAHNVENQGKNARNLLSNLNLFGDWSDKLYIKRMRSLRDVMHGNEVHDKAVWKFNNVEELADFTENAKLLARKAPSTLKFLLGKSPIFIVGGLALGEGDTLGEKAHAMWEGLLGLVPIVGPCLILRDGLWAGDNTNWGQAAVGAALLTVDAVHFGKGLIRGDVAKLTHMFTQPLMDLVEVTRFFRQTGKNTIKMVSDGVRLAREGKMSGLGGKAAQFMREIMMTKRGAAAAAIGALAIRTVYEIIPEGMDKEAEVMFAKYKNDPNGLDRAISENWTKFDQDTKNECIKYAIIGKLAIPVEKTNNMQVDYKDGTYSVSVPTLINKETGNAMLASLEDNIARVEPNAKIQMQVRGEVAFNFRKQLAEKLQKEGVKPEEMSRIVDEQIAAMGYDPNIGKA